MEVQNEPFSPEIPPHSHSNDTAAQFSTQLHSSNDATAQLTTQSAAKGKHKVSNSQDHDYGSESIRERAKRKKTDTFVKQASSRLGGGRVFTEEDEIAILRGLLEYKHKNNISDMSSINWSKVHVYLTVEGKLSTDLTVNQIYEKVRGLKKKYMKNLEKEKNEEGSFLISQHDIIVFKISKKVWGGAGSDIDPSDEIGVDDEVMAEEKNKEAQHGFDTDGEDCGLSKSSGHPFSMNKKLRNVGSEKTMKLEMKWMKLRLREINHQMKKLEMESDLIKIAMNEMKKD